MVDEQKTGPPIIIVKKKAGHGGHHGGAWKVAYADFVTAMMALFIVLWLMTSSEQTRKAIGGYFQDPKGFGKQTGSTLAGNGESIAVTKDEMGQIKKTGRRVETSRVSGFEGPHSDYGYGRGSAIELLESEKGIFFNSGSPKPSEFGTDLLTRLSAELGKLPNAILIEGHTDLAPFSGESNYTNWELSTDRANAARRIMQETGLRGDQVKCIRGYADQRLRNVMDSKDPSNRRISVIVQYAANSPASAAASAAPAPSASATAPAAAPAHVKSK